MRLPSLLSPSAKDLVRFSQLAILLTSLSHKVAAIDFSAVPSANLDLSQLGRVGLVGDFDGISLYQYEGQSESGYSNNGSQSVLARLPNGGFASLAMADASIMDMCNFVMSSGEMAGVIVGGNFTSLGGIESQGVAMLNPNTSDVTALPGISGKVAAVYCDQTSNTVYVGGSFSAANSTNAIAWVGTAGWTNLPFQGFNGPVTSITKAANGHIIFGGTFTGLGNVSTPTTSDAQVVNIANATITAGSSTTTSGFSDPNNIVCKTSGTDGTGSTWLLEDDTAGYWDAQFNFGFRPTKLRLWNTKEDGRGTKTFRFTAQPINGIMNFTYTDPSTGANSSCTSECPLSQTSTYQDFYFVNVIGMNGFRVDISAWYGSGGGLDGIELFQDDIYAYAIDAFNEPTCADISTASTVTTTGEWSVTPSHTSSSEWLTMNLSTGYNADSAQVVFMPDIKQSGNYTVNIYTPGCVQDNTCATRQRVNVSGTMGDGNVFQTTLYQTNNYDKYDQIYTGYVSATSSSFRASITLQPISGQQGPVTVVAQRVGFFLDSSSGSVAGLNSIFEWNPSLAMVNTSEFSTSVFDQAGVSIGDGGVLDLVSSSSLTFVGGNFTATDYDNIFVISSTGSSSLANGGLNGPVMTLSLNGSTLYAGGNFSGTRSGQISGLNNVASYDISSSAWSALGAGVNGRVVDVVSLTMNVTSSTPETVIALTGNFNQIEAFNSNAASTVDGFAIWVPSQSNWLQNINATTMSVSGSLSTELSVAYSGGQTLWSGSVSSSQLGANGAAELGSSLSSFPVSIEQSQSQSQTSLSKRATTSGNITGVVTGIFDESSNRNLTVLGGHFTATSTNGSTIYNIAIINGSNSNTVTGIGSGLSSESTVLALQIQNNTLFAGGSLSGTINGNSISGLIAYDLSASDLPSQPPALIGGSATVNAIAARPSSSDLYVGGNFQDAGALTCPAVCVYSTTAEQWNRPGTSLSGAVNAMLWSTTTTLVAGGELTVSGSNTSLASYSTSSTTWTAYNGASNIPGPITALTAASSDNSQLWVAGTATNGSIFLMKYDGTNWNAVGSTLGSSTVIRGLQMFSLTSNHGSTSLVPQNQALMLTGSIYVPGFGNASAVLYNGTAFTPYALTTSTSGSGSLATVFTQQQNFFSSPSSGIALGFIVLIGLGIALGLIFLIVVAGILLSRYRKKRDGYVPAPTNMYDRNSAIAHLPPEQIFGTVGNRNPAAPVI